MATAKTRTSIVNALMELAAERRFEDVTLEAIAERAGVTLLALREAYDGRVAILADYAARIDRQVLSDRDPDMGEEAPRERLFDVLFARLEALGPDKAAIANLLDAGRRDPLLGLALNWIGATSMAWMLTGAGIDALGALGAVRAQGLAFVWARTLRVWLDDDDPGLARTMAELDRRLREAERNYARLNRVARFFRGGRRRRPSSTPRRRESDDGHEPGAPAYGE
jgi:AcrR family transcriptional regulator